MSIGCVVVPSMSRSSGSYVEKESYISCHSRGRWALDKLSRESRLLVDSFVWNVVSSLWEEVRGSVASNWFISLMLTKLSTLFILIMIDLTSNTRHRIRHTRRT